MKRLLISIPDLTEHKIESPATPIYISEGLLILYYVTLVCSLLILVYICRQRRQGQRNFARTESQASRRDTIIASRASMIETPNKSLDTN